MYDPLQVLCCARVVLLSGGPCLLKHAAVCKYTDGVVSDAHLLHRNMVEWTQINAGAVSTALAARFMTGFYRNFFHMASSITPSLVGTSSHTKNDVSWCVTI